MLKKLKLIKAESVLIIGGGDCSVLKKIIPNKHLKDIYMFEQDQQVVEIAKKYSTHESAQFVNGVLDSVKNDLMQKEAKK